LRWECGRAGGRAGVWPVQNNVGLERTAVSCNQWTFAAPPPQTTIPAAVPPAAGAHAAVVDLLDADGCREPLRDLPRFPGAPPWAPFLPYIPYTSQSPHRPASQPASQPLAVVALAAPHTRTPFCARSPPRALLQIRMQLHLPLQFATMGLAAWNLPRICAEVRAGPTRVRGFGLLQTSVGGRLGGAPGLHTSHLGSSGAATDTDGCMYPPPLPQCYPGAASGSCFRSGALMAAAFGFVLPTAGLRYIEQRSRNLFCNLLRTAAASSN
jgi:hypothetical protein